MYTIKQTHIFALAALREQKSGLPRPWADLLLFLLTKFSNLAEGQDTKMLLSKQAA